MQTREGNALGVQKTGKHARKDYVRRAVAPVAVEVFHHPHVWSVGPDPVIYRFECLIYRNSHMNYEVDLAACDKSFPDGLRGKRVEGLRDVLREALEKKLNGTVSKFLLDVIGWAEG